MKRGNIATGSLHISASPLRMAVGGVELVLLGQSVRARAAFWVNHLPGSGDTYHRWELPGRKLNGKTDGLYVTIKSDTIRQKNE